MICVAAAVLAQYALGVTTLLLVVPVSVATLHQAGAVVLLTARCSFLCTIYPTRPRQRIEALPAIETTVP